MTDDKALKLAKAVKQLKTQVSELINRTETITKLQGPSGKDGKDGKNGIQGLPGRDGRDGRDGSDGKDGLDGIGVASVEVTFDNSLVVRLTDGTEIDAGQINVESSGNGQSQVVVQQYSGPKIFVQSTQPEGAQPGDIWLDTSP